MKYFCLKGKEKKVFGILLVLFALYVAPIILADRYYNDDLGRILKGETGWNGDGRPLTEQLMRALCGGMPIVDISPLPLIMGGCLLAYVLVLYARENIQEKELIWVQAIGLFFAVANPLLLANLSYKFDALSMLTALSAVILCYTIPDSLRAWKRLLCFCILCIISLSLYQAAIGAYLALLLMDVFWKGERKEKFLAAGLVRLAGLGIGGILYKVAIADRFVSRGDWRWEASQYITEPSIQSLKIIYSNVVNICTAINGKFGSSFLAVKVVLLAAALIFIADRIIKVCRNESYRTREKVLWSFYILFLPVAVFLACLLPLFFLRSLTVSSSRTFISLSICTLLFGIFLMKLYRKNKALVAAAFAVCMIVSFSYVYAYGNALEGQKNYETYLGMNIARDVEMINRDNEYKVMTIDGSTPRAQQVDVACRKYPQFTEIVPVYITNSSWIGGAWLYYYLQNDLWYEEMTEEDRAVVEAGEPVVRNDTYSCYVNGEKIIIHFN